MYVCMYMCTYMVMCVRLRVMYLMVTTAEKDSMVDNAVLMDPPSSGKLIKTASFSDDGTL